MQLTHIKNGFSDGPLLLVAISTVPGKNRINTIELDELVKSARFILVWTEDVENMVVN